MTIERFGSVTEDIRQIVDEKVELFIGEMCGIVSAGGEGVRLRPITIEQPKPLVEVGSPKQPLIYWSMLPMILGGISHFIIGIRHGAAKIRRRIGSGRELSRRFGREITVVYVEEPEPLGRAGCIKYGIEQGIINPERPTIIFNASDILRLNLKDLVRHHLLLKTYRGFEVTQVYTSGFRVRYGIGRVNYSTSQVTSFKEKPIFRSLANTACYVIHGRLRDFKDVRKVPSNPEEELVPKWLRENTLGAYIISPDDVISIKFQKDLEQVCEMDIDKFVRGAYEP
ncbi:MAG: sugar phosphate nucleotidyltransferase [Candidatus Bathyarchaeia archaeon]